MAAEAPIPVSFSINDPELKFVQAYSIRDELPATLAIGDCPDAPCINLRLHRINLNRPFPALELSLHGMWDGALLFDRQSMGADFPLKVGCHLRISSRAYDLLLEVADDRVVQPRVWAAVYAGSLEESGTRFDGAFCP